MAGLEREGAKGLQRSLARLRNEPCALIKQLDLIMPCMPECNTLSALTVWLRNACSSAWHWQTLMPGKLTCPTPRQKILLYTQLQYQSCTGGSYICREACRDSLASGELAICSERLTPNSNSLCGHEPYALITQKTYRVQSSTYDYSGIFLSKHLNSKCHQQLIY